MPGRLPVACIPLVSCCLGEEQYHTWYSSFCTFRFVLLFGQVVAEGPAWECARIEGQRGADEIATEDEDEAPGHEAKVEGALSLLVELDQVWCWCYDVEVLTMSLY